MVGNMNGVNNHLTNRWRFDTFWCTHCAHSHRSWRSAFGRIFWGISVPIKNHANHWYQSASVIGFKGFPICEIISSTYYYQKTLNLCDWEISLICVTQPVGPSSLLAGSEYVNHFGVSDFLLKIPSPKICCILWNGYLRLNWGCVVN